MDIFILGNNQPEIETSIEELLYILEELKSQITDELIASPQGPLSKLLKEITSVNVLDENHKEESNNDLRPVNMSTKVDTNEINSGKFSFKN